MPRLFGEQNPRIKQKHISLFFRILDALDVSHHLEQLHLLKQVSRAWRDAINEYGDRLVISMAIFSECESFIGESHHSLQSVRQLSGGMTNKTLLFQVKNNKFIARLPGKNTSEFISRPDESHNIRVVNQLGIGAELIFDNPDGVQVTRFLPQPQPMTGELLKNKENIILCMRPLKKLHTAAVRFHADTDVFQRNKSMTAILHACDIVLDSDYERFSQAMDIIEKQLSCYPIEKTACHNDTTPSNFLLSNNEVKLIDWEYANNNDRMWDLACLSTEAKFNSEQDTAMLEAYFGSYDTATYKHFILYKPVVEYWVVLWANVQIANKNYSDKSSFAALQNMIEARKQSCLFWLDHPDFKAASQMNGESLTSTRYNQR